MESLKELIEKRAYHLFLKRNGAHGYHMQDWVLAEKEVRAEQEAKKKAEAKPIAQAQRAEPPKAAPVAPKPAPVATPTSAPVDKSKMGNKGMRRR
jgi:hypothetical protein